MQAVRIQHISPFAPEVIGFIEEINKYNLLHYPPEVCHLDPPEVLARENCVMLGAFYENELCGIGAVKLFEDYGEIKRMFVPEKFRGRGISRLILDSLLRIIQEKGLAWARLETGAKFEAAMSLYQRSGFEICEPFGNYEKTPVNVYMQKSL